MHQDTRLTLWGSLVNLVLSAVKILAGVLARSQAMIADGIHSLSDLSTDIAVIVGLGAARKPEDDNHSFGHGRFETLTSAFIGLALLGVGLFILLEAARSLRAVFVLGVTPPAPGWLAFAMAVVSIVAKELLFQVTYRYGKKRKSPAIIANAWHHRTDALSSIGTMLGIGGAILLGERWTVLDPVAALVVSLFILKVGFSVTKEALYDLTDAAVPDATRARIMEIARSVEGVRDPHNLRTRRIGADIAMELHVRLPGSATVAEAHEIASRVERSIKAELGAGTRVITHVEPEKTRAPA